MLQTEAVLNYNLDLLFQSYLLGHSELKFSISINLDPLFADAYLHFLAILVF